MTKRIIWILPITIMALLLMLWSASLSSVNLADSPEDVNQRERTTQTPTPTPTGTRTITVTPTPGNSAARGTEAPSGGRSREIVRATATPDGFEATPSPTPGLAAGGGGGGFGECIIAGQSLPVSPAAQVAVSTDGTRGYAITRQDDKNMLTVLDFLNPNDSYQLPEHIYSVNNATISNDGRWLITRDAEIICSQVNEFDFLQLTEREVNGAVTYIWDLNTPGELFAQTDFDFSADSWWSNAYPAVLTVLNPFQPDQSYNILNMNSPDRILSLPADTTQALWSADGQAIVAMVRPENTDTSELIVYEFTGDDLIQQQSELILGEAFDIQLVGAESMDRVAVTRVTSSSDLIVYDFAQNDQLIYPLIDQDAGLFNTLQVDWARNQFSVREISSNTAEDVLRIQPFDGSPATLIDIGGNLNEIDTDILTVRFTETRDEVLIESMSSVFWWDYSTPEPELLNIFIKQPPTIESPIGKIGETGFVRWLSDETILVIDGRINDEDSVTPQGRAVMMFWDLTQSFIGTYIEFSADFMEFYPHPELPLLYGIDQLSHDMIALDLETLTATPLTNLTEVESYPALPTDRDIYADFNCPGSLPPHLELGNFVIVTDSEANNLRTAPSLSGELLNVQLGQGMQTAIIGGPVCADGFVWWQVGGGDLVLDDSVAWTAGGDEFGYWLEQVPAPNREIVSFTSVPLAIEVIGRTDGSSGDESVVSEPDNDPITTPDPQPIPGDMILVAGDNFGELAVGNTDTWAYQGRAGEEITVTVIADWDTTLEAFLNGDSLAFNDDTFDLLNPANSQLSIVIDGDGDTIEFAVRGYEDAVGGAYTLTLETDAPIDSDPIPTVAPMLEGFILLPGENVGELAIGDMDTWLYIGSAGEEITVTITADWDTTLEAFFNGEPLAFNDDTPSLDNDLNSQLVLTVDDDGDTIEFNVRGFGDSVGGAYTITLESNG